MIIPINVDNKKIEERIVFEKFIVEKLSPKCLDEDFEAVIENEELIKETRGNAGDWPNPDTLSKEENLLDLAWHQREFEYNLSFAFLIRDLEGKYMGCIYLYPMGFRSSPPNKNEFEVDFSFWLTKDFYNQGFYEVVRSEFTKYLQDIGFTKIYYSNLK
jgi:RimJ/RimL family protein N-acetyltransferase